MSAATNVPTNCPCGIQLFWPPSIETGLCIYCRGVSSPQPSVLADYPNAGKCGHAAPVAP